MGINTGSTTLDKREENIKSIQDISTGVNTLKSNFKALTAAILLSVPGIQSVQAKENTFTYTQDGYTFVYDLEKGDISDICYPYLEGDKTDEENLKSFTVCMNGVDAARAAEEDFMHKTDKELAKTDKELAKKDEELAKKDEELAKTDKELAKLKEEALEKMNKIKEEMEREAGL